MLPLLPPVAPLPPARGNQVAFRLPSPADQKPSEATHSPFPNPGIFPKGTRAADEVTQSDSGPLLRRELTKRAGSRLGLLLVLRERESLDGVERHLLVGVITLVEFTERPDDIQKLRRPRFRYPRLVDFLPFRHQGRDDLLFDKRIGNGLFLDRPMRPRPFEEETLRRSSPGAENVIFNTRHLRKKAGGRSRSPFVVIMTRGGFPRLLHRTTEKRRLKTLVPQRLQKTIRHRRVRFVDLIDQHHRRAGRRILL